MLLHKSFSLSCVMVLAVASAWPSSASSATVDQSHFAQSSKLSNSNARYVKIRCKEAGIQQITPAQLREWGFSSSLTKIRVLGFSTAALYDNKLDADNPDDLQVIKTYRTGSGDGARLFFYNPGVYDITVNSDASLPRNPTFSVSENRYSDYAYYIVTDGVTTSDLLPNLTSSTSGTMSQYHLSVNYTRHRDLHPEDGGSFYVGETSTDKLTYNFSLMDPVRGTASRAVMSLRYGFQATRNPGTAFKLTPEMPVVDATQIDDVECVSTRNASLVSEVYKHYGNTAWSNVNFKVLSPSAADLINPLPITIETPNVSDNQYHSLSNWIAPHDEMVIYLRHNYLRGPQMLTYVNNFDTLKALSFPKSIPASGSMPAQTVSTSTLKVWDVTDVANITNITPRDTGTKLRFDMKSQVAEGCHKLIAFNPEATQYIPEMVGEVRSQNLHAIGAGNDPVPEMVIVTVDDLRPYAEQLAALHRNYQGMDVRVVTHDEIINEFSSGTPHAMGYRLFSKMLFERGRDTDRSHLYDDEDEWLYDGSSRIKIDDSSRFRYILLMGPMSSDNVHMSTPGNGYLLTYQAEDPFLTNVQTGNYALADYFGIVNDDFTGDSAHKMYASVSVGVLDVHTPVEATQILGKIEKYLQGFPSESDNYHRITMLGDVARQFTEDAYNGRATAALANPAAMIDNVYTELYDAGDDEREDKIHADIAASLNAGSYFFTFVGHSSATAFESEVPIWNNRLIASTYYDNPPFAALGSCSTFAYDYYRNNLVHNFLFKADGGLMAVVASAREVFPAQNLQMVQEMTRRLFSAKPAMNIGDVYRAAKRTIVRSNNLATTAYDNLTVNTACYVLAGDPALPVIGLSDKAVVTEIAGRSVAADDEGTVKVNPFTTVTLKGRVAPVSDASATNTAFDGTAIITVLDGPDRSVLGTMDIEWDKTPVVRLNVPVKAGVFEASFVMPEGSLPGIGNRISIYAFSADKKMLAAGVTKALVVNKVEGAESGDSQPPVISAMYLDDASFRDGDKVSASPTLHAVLSDAQTGLQVSGNLNGNFRLVLDGTTEMNNALSYLSPAPDGEMKLAYPLSNLSDGRHSLTLTVSDNAGNITEQTVNFTVISTDLNASLVIAESPVRELMSFEVVDGGLLSETAELTLIVRDMEGHTVYSAAGVGTAGTWDLTGLDGQKVADGRYKANVIMRDGNLYGHTPSVEFVVVK